MREIYTICTCSDRGRFVATSTTDRARATVTAERMTAGYVADGYRLTETQHIDPPRRWADVPDVVTVWRLKATGGVWLNIELYRVRENENED